MQALPPFPGPNTIAPNSPQNTILTGKLGFTKHERNLLSFSAKFSSNWKSSLLHVGWFTCTASLPGPSATWDKQFQIASNCLLSSRSLSTISDSLLLRRSRHLSRVLSRDTRFLRSYSICSFNATSCRSCRSRPMTLTRVSDTCETCVFIVVSASATFLILRDTLCIRCCFLLFMTLVRFADKVFASATNFCRSYFNVSNFKAPFEASIKLRSNSLKPLKPSVSVGASETGNSVWLEVDEISFCI